MITCRSLLFLALLCTQVFAGSGTATISGKTSSGRTSLELKVEDISGILSSVKLTIDGKSYEIVNDSSEDTRDTVILDSKIGVYVLMIESEEKIFRMWMVPGSEKVIEQGDGSYKSTFAAVIEASDPREDGKYNFAPRITIGCTLDYSI